MRFMGVDILEESKAKMRRKAMGRGARSYPAFFNERTEEIIPSGFNLNALCRERDLSRSHMSGVASGQLRSCHSWILLNSDGGS